MSGHLLHVKMSRWISHGEATKTRRCISSIPVHKILRFLHDIQEEVFLFLYTDLTEKESKVKSKVFWKGQRSASTMAAKFKAPCWREVKLKFLFKIFFHFNFSCLNPLCKQCLQLREENRSNRQKLQKKKTSKHLYESRLGNWAKVRNKSFRTSQT